MSAVTGWRDPTATPSQPLNKVVFTTGSKVTIHAPASRVFDVITAFSRYHEWNTWTTDLIFNDNEVDGNDSSDGERKRKADLDVRPGDKGILKTRMEEQNRDYEIPLEVSFPQTLPFWRIY